MDQRYFKQIVLIGTLVFYTCISIPEVPNNGFERCIAHYYNVKRRMREIQIQNKNFTAVIVLVSFGVGFWVGPIGFVPLIVLPYTQYRNKRKPMKSGRSGRRSIVQIHLKLRLKTASSMSSHVLDVRFISLIIVIGYDNFLE